MSLIFAKNIWMSGSIELIKERKKLLLTHGGWVKSSKLTSFFKPKLKEKRAKAKNHCSIYIFLLFRISIVSLFLLVHNMNIEKDAGNLNTSVP